MISILHCISMNAYYLERNYSTNFLENRRKIVCKKCSANKVSQNSNHHSVQLRASQVSSAERTAHAGVKIRICYIIS